MRLGEIAAAVDGTLTSGAGIEIRGMRSLERAGEGELAFLMDDRHLAEARQSEASAFIAGLRTEEWGKPLIRSKNPYLAFARALGLFYHQPLPEGPFVHPTAVVDESVTLGEGCYLGAHVVVEAGVKMGSRVRILPNSTVYTGAVLGDDVLVHSNCVIREYCVLGNRVILQNGCVIGGDGFGFAPDDKGVYHKIVQAGRVVLGDDVEIQANTCVDRGSLEDTVIGRGTKLDNLIQVGHGCEVGQNVVMASQSGLAGSTILGDRVMVGGQSGVAGHCRIGNGVMIFAGSGVAGDVEDGKKIWGWLATDQRVYRRAVLLFPKLPEINTRLRRLEAKLNIQEGDHEQ